MKPSDIRLNKVSKNFEYEKLSRDIDTINDVNTLKEMLKCYVKLYFKQQEIVTSLGLISVVPRKEGEINVGDTVKFIGGSKEQRNWGGTDPAYHLIIDHKYTVTNVEVRSQHTRIEVKGIQGVFNSVLFQVVNDQH
jgi:hypothetical protein